MTTTTTDRTITVYGASGHTGRFVVAELCRRGWEPVLSGRDAGRLLAVAAAHGGLETRPAEIDSPDALDRALAGAGAVIGCAGPFASTATPLIEAARRAGIAYLDVAAEIEAVADVVADHDEPARAAGVVVVPAMAFFGGLGDLLATAAAREWTSVDEVTIACALDRWEPTEGTRAAGRVSSRRRDGRRVVYADGGLAYRSDERAVVDWDFPEPIGRTEVVADFTTADSVTIPRHLTTPVVRTYMSAVAVRDVGDPDRPPPTPTDDLGRSAQTFLVEVVVRSGATERRAVARGRDIYAISAPLVVEAAERVLDGRVTGTGVLTAGQAFDAPDLLRALPLSGLTIP